MSVQNEPSPLWFEAPRLVPWRAFPPYRFVPGRNAHPRQNPQGYSYGRDEEIPAYLPPERWRENELYLFGVDLYHAGYLWESHEAWETLWHLADKEGCEGQLLQGLIQNSAALLKVHLNHWGGARHLSREAQRRIHFVALQKPSSFMGLDVPEFLAAMEAYYEPLWKGGEAVADPAPRINLR